MKAFMRHNRLVKVYNLELDFNVKNVVLENVRC
jgi:hypothetical protein